MWVGIKHERKDVLKASKLCSAYITEKRTAKKH